MYTILINGEVKYTRSHRPNGLWKSTVRSLECEGGAAFLMFNGACLQSAGEYSARVWTEADESKQEEARLFAAAAPDGQPQEREEGV